MEQNSAHEPQAGAEAPNEFVEVLRAIYAYGWLVVLLSVLALAAAYVITAKQPRIFQATAVLEYDPNPPRPLGDNVQDVASPAADFWTSREFFETQNRIIASRMVAERVVTKLGLHRDRTFVDEGTATPEGLSVSDTAQILQSRVTVEAIDGTRLVNIRVRDRNPQRATLIANTIVDTFIDKTIEDRMGSTVTSLRWLGEQLDNLRRELDESELALHRFKQEHNVLSVSMEDRQNLVSSQLQQFSQALNETRRRRIELQARLTRLQTLAAAATPEAQAAALAEQTAVAALQVALRTKLAERESLAPRYLDQHPHMQQLTQEIDSMRAQLRAEIEGVLRAAQADVRQAAEMESGLRHAVDEANTQGLALNLREIEYTRLSRQRENNSKMYQLVLERTTETDLTRMLRTTHVRTVDRAIVPSVPVSPNALTNLAVGGALGLGLGIAIALVLARIDRRIRSAEDAEAQGVMVLGVLPMIANDGGPSSYPRAPSGARAVSRRKNKASQLDDFTGSRDIIAHTHPLSATAENCRTIRTNLMFMSGEEPIRTLAITSANPRDGKTTVTTNLAISLAQSGKRVLLVDTDMRRPRVHAAFGFNNKVGITSYLVGDATLEAVTQKTEVAGLFVVPCGPVPPNPSELLHREKFRKFLGQARDAYDFVVFDSPPLGAVTDAAVLAPQVDRVVIVVRAGATTRDALRSCLKKIRDVNAKLAGAVVNALDPNTARSGYYHYYYYKRDGYYGSTDNEKTPEAQA